MKKKYEVAIIEELYKTFIIEADSQDDAIRIAMRNYRECVDGYILMAEDHASTSFDIVKKEDKDE